jgi:hypothetical protein
MTAKGKGPDRKVDIKDNQLGIKLIPMISTWDQVDPIFPVRVYILLYCCGGGGCGCFTQLMRISSWLHVKSFIANFVMKKRTK